MDRGGIQTWLMHILRHMDREAFRVDFLVLTEEPCAYDDEIRALGSRVIPCLHHHWPWAFAWNFAQALRRYGPYDVVHSHCSYYSGFVLLLARLMGIPVRIAHSHSDTRAHDAQANLLRRAYLAGARRWIRRHGTHGLACSAKAAECFFGTHWRTDPRWRVHFCGIDLKPFREPAEPAAVRAELGIPREAFIVGHVGRFTPEKNHAFFLAVMAEVIRRTPAAYAVLVGDGPLRAEVEAQANHMGLADRVRFLGVRADVPRLMQGAMDVFLLPSLREGLPLVLVEGQAAGLPCVISDVIAEEADVVPALIHRCSLNDSAAAWAEAVVAASSRPHVHTQAECRGIVEASPFNVDNAVRDLAGMYEAWCCASMKHGS